MNKYEFEYFKKNGGLKTVSDGKPDSIFLVCASYEPRTIAIVESLSPDYRAEKGVIYVNKEFQDELIRIKVESNLTQLKHLLTKHCNSVVVIEGSWLDAKIQLDRLREALIPSEYTGVNETTVTIDTTTFNRESLLTATMLIKKNYSILKIRIIYVSPQDHGEWLSRGFRCVRNVMGFSGIQQASRTTLVVILCGFEPDRAVKIIEEHEPFQILLGIGDPPTTQKFLERNLKEEQLVEQRLILAKQDVAQFNFPVYDIKKCWDCLEEILRPYFSKYNIILAPMSTKLSTLAALLVAEKHPEIQITYCVPGEYNTDGYSTGINSVFIDFLPTV